MTLISEQSGCKVGWAYYSTEAEATERSKVESERRDRKFEQGYDFGYQWPGTVEHLKGHHEYGECWKVTLA